MTESPVHQAPAITPDMRRMGRQTVVRGNGLVLGTQSLGVLTSPQLVVGWWELAQDAAYGSDSPSGCQCTLALDLWH